MYWKVSVETPQKGTEMRGKVSVTVISTRDGSEKRAATRMGLGNSKTLLITEQWQPPFIPPVKGIAFLVHFVVCKAN